MACVLTFWLTNEIWLNYYLYFSENLGLTTPDYYNYLNQTGTYKVDGTDDVQEFKDTMVW